MAYIIKDKNDQPIKKNGEDVLAADIVGNDIVVKAVNMEKRTLSMVGSTEDVDRDGDIMLVRGFELENYVKNPVFLWAHNYYGVPVGSVSRIKKLKDPWRLFFEDIKFPPLGLYPFADMVLEMYNQKFLNASSVGFIPKEWEWIEEKDGQGSTFRTGRKFMKQELLELSGCSVPANPHALQNALKGFNFKGIKPDVILNSLSGMIPQELNTDWADDVLSELSIGKIEIEEADSKVHQVPDQIEDQKIEDEQVEKIESDQSNLDVEKTSEEKGGEIEGEQEEEVEKPYPNEHACRLNSPDKYDRFRRSSREHDGKKYSIIFGKVKGKDKWEEQAYRYNKSTWTSESAKSHCGSHGGSFEAASRSVEEEFTTIITGVRDDLLSLSSTVTGGIESIKIIVKELVNDLKETIKQLALAKSDSQEEFPDEEPDDLSKSYFTDEESVKETDELSAEEKESVARVVKEAKEAIEAQRKLLNTKFR